MTSTPDLPTVRQAVQDVPIPLLAAKFGTPLQVLARDQIDNWIENTASCDSVCHPVAMSDPLVLLQRIADRGGIATASNAAEIARATEAGFVGSPGRTIEFVGEYFDDRSLQRCVELGLPVRCGSPDMITQLGRVRPGCEVSLHVNTGSNATPPQMGVWHAGLNDCCLRADQDGITISGLHVSVADIGDPTKNSDHWEDTINIAEDLAVQIGRPLMQLSIGLAGHWASDSVASILTRSNDLRDRLANRFGHSIRLRLDSGESLRRAATTRIASIRSIKTADDRRFFIADSNLDGHSLAACAAKADASLRQHSDATIVSADGQHTVTMSLPSLAMGDFIVVSGARPSNGAKVVLVADGKATLAS